MGDGFVEEASYPWWYPSFGEDAGERGPFLSGLVEVLVYGGPVVVGGSHDPSEVFESVDRAEGGAMDGYLGLSGLRALKECGTAAFGLLTTAADCGVVVGAV